MKKYFFLSYCYGSHAKYLIEIALPSLFLEQNLPFLTSKFSVIFLFCVDSRTKKMIRQFFFNKQDVSFRFLKFKKPKNQNSKIQNMALHHCAMLKEVKKFNGICSFVYPESIYLNGTITEISKLIKSGFKAGVIPAWRGPELTKKNKKIFKNLKKLSRKKMIKFLIRHLNPEMITQNVREKYSFANFCCIFIQKQFSIFLQDTVWDPLFLDIGSAQNINWLNETRMSIDDGFIFRNFKKEEIYVCKNNPDIGFFGFSEKRKPYPAKPILAKNLFAKICRECLRFKNIYLRVFASYQLFKNNKIRYNLLWETVVISDSRQPYRSILFYGLVLKLYLLISKIFGPLLKKINLEKRIRYQK